MRHVKYYLTNIYSQTSVSEYHNGIVKSIHNKSSSAVMLSNTEPKLSLTVR